MEVASFVSAQQLPKSAPLPTAFDPGLSDDHILEMRSLMERQDPNAEERAASIKIPAEPAKYADVLRESGSFADDKKPGIVTSWNLRDTAAIDLQGNVYMMMERAPGAHSISDMASIPKASAWVPHAQDGGMDVTAVPEGNPYYITSRNMQKGYAIIGAIAKGGYGTVYDAIRINPRNVGNVGPSAPQDSRVAIKFVLAKSIRTGEGDAAVISPGSVAGMFINYAIQRSYGGCMPFTVCMQDIFLYAKPKNSLSDNPEMDWYVAIVMERMSGHIGHLVNTMEFRRVIPGHMQHPRVLTERIKAFGLLMSKCCRAIYDLELLRIWHNDIKPSNFLWKGSDSVVQVTDFDISVFAQYMSRGREEPYEAARAAYIRARTDGGVDVRQEPWRSDGDTADLLGSFLQTTSFYEPPEYRKISDLLGRGSGQSDQNKAKLKALTIHRAEWWSRMMLYQLIATFRELCLETGLNQPYYVPYTREKVSAKIQTPSPREAPFVGTYVKDVTLPNAMAASNRSERGFAFKFNQMKFDQGDGCIAPCPVGTPFSTRLEAWRKIRSSTINIDYFISVEKIKQEVVDFARWFNNVVEHVICPKIPTDERDERVYYPLLNPAVPYCVPSGDGATMNAVRPFVSTFMADLTRHLGRCGWIDVNAHKRGLRVPTSVEELSHM